MVDHKDFAQSPGGILLIESFGSMESQGGMDRLGLRPKVDADEGTRTLDSTRFI